MSRLIYSNSSFFSGDTLDSFFSFFSPVKTKFLSLDHYLNFYFPVSHKAYVRTLYFNPFSTYRDAILLCEDFSEQYPWLTRQMSAVLNYLLSMDLSVSIINSSEFSLVMGVLFSDWFYFSFVFCIFLLLFFSFVLKYFRPKFFSFNFVFFYKNFLNLWISFTGIRFESFEESFCVIVLWPWCIFLVFTHVFYLENNEIFFIFIEWGLPIIIGFMIIIESIWVFGCHIFLYLTGSRGRRSFFVVLVEDLIAFTILFGRIILQMVRGVICSFYHDFFRDIFEFITLVWDDIFVFSDVNISNSSFFLRLVLFFIDIYVMAMVLFFIYFILFLQLLFLLIAVWLFCRCWFISSRYLEVIRSRGWDESSDNFIK